jgi:DNA-binding transcriptional ArsR family regulator
MSAVEPGQLHEVHDSLPDPHTVSHMADVFSLLGDSGRLRILTALLGGSLRVRDIAAVTHQSQSSVSHALRLLRAHHVVTATRSGREAHYELADQHVRELLELALAHVQHEA